MQACLMEYGGPNNIQGAPLKWFNFSSNMDK